MVTPTYPLKSLQERCQPLLEAIEQNDGTAIAKHRDARIKGKEFGSLLEACMGNAVSRADIARHLGISALSVTRWRQNHNLPSNDMIAKLLEYLASAGAAAPTANSLSACRYAIDQVDEMAKQLRDLRKVLVKAIAEEEAA